VSKKGIYQTEVKQFSTITQGLSELSHWMQGEQVDRVAMESTGNYWIPVWRALESDFKLLSVNPYFIKQIPWRKMDNSLKLLFTMEVSRRLRPTR
jgi:transposase